MLRSLGAASRLERGWQLPQSSTLTGQTIIMPSDDDKARAEQLKVEGNALHAKGNYVGARSKYSDAIKLDGENAVLYANRAAAYIASKQ